MRQIAVKILILGAIVSLGQGVLAASLLERPTKPLFVPNQIIVKVKNNNYSAHLKTLNRSFGAKTLKRFTSLNNGIELVGLPSNVSVEQAIEYYQKNPSIAYAEPNFIYYANEDVTGADPFFNKQWPLQNLGQTGGITGVDLNAPLAWTMTKGSKDAVLAVVDTGVLYTHPDLAANMWKNTEEIPGNGIDDDGNGYIDDVYGINAITKTGDPLDDNSHGTHVAGIMGAVGGNSVGISGVNQTVSIIACKFLDANGSGDSAAAIACLDYLAALAKRPKNPVHIVATNNSWGGGGFSQGLYDAIKAHEQLGILFMAAASNDASDNDVTDTYPANYNLANIISIAATDSKDALASFSNTGRRSVHVAAPGVAIFSSVLNNGYDTYSGTSMATPHVTGLAGLIKAQFPNADWITVRNLIIAGGLPVAALSDKTISGRRIKAAGTDGTGSLTCVNQPVHSRILPKGDNFTLNVGDKLEVAALGINCGQGDSSFSINVGGQPFALSDNGQNGDQIANDGIFESSLVLNQAGSYTIDFGNNDAINVTVFDAGSWKGYQVSETNYVYRQISGTKINAGDDTVHKVTSPFPVHFASDSAGFSDMYVNSNGTISFTEGKVINFRNETLPYKNFTTLIAAYWDDLDASQMGGIYYDVVGSAPNREFIVEWRGVANYETGKPMTFQVVFAEGKTDVLINYKDVDTKKDINNFGASATIGVQHRKDAAILYSYNQAKLKKNETALLFSLAGTPLESKPIVAFAGTQKVQASLGTAKMAGAPIQLGGCRAMGSSQTAMTMLLAYAGVILLRRRKS